MKKYIKRGLCCIALGLSAFTLGACTTEDLETIQFRYDENTGYVQYLVDSNDSWANVISKEQLMEYLGDDLKGNPGVNGREVEFGKNDTHILWKYSGETQWNELCLFTDLYENEKKCTITYDFNLPYNTTLANIINNGEIDFSSSGFVFDTMNVDTEKEVIDIKCTSTSLKGDFYKLYDFDAIGLGDIFKGWYANDILIDEYRVIGEDIVLKAKWDDQLNDDRDHDGQILCFAYQVSEGVFESVGYGRCKIQATINDNDAFLNKIVNYTPYFTVFGGKYDKLVLPDYVLYNNRFIKITDIRPNETDINNYDLFDNINSPAIESLCTIWLPKFVSIEILSLMDAYTYFEVDRVTFLHKNLTLIGKVDDFIYYTGKGAYNYYIARNTKDYSTAIFHLDETRTLASLISFRGDLGSDNIWDLSESGIKFYAPIKFIYENGSATYYHEFFPKITSVEIDCNHLTSGTYEFGVIIGENVNIYSDHKLFAGIKINSLLEGSIIHLYYLGDEKKSVQLQDGVNVYYYSETQPSDSNYTYWHYDTDGVTPVLWEVQE